MSAKKTEISGVGYVLGHGVCNNPASVRHGGTYSLVGVANEDGEWEDIQPYTKDEALVEGRSPGMWLESMGPGRLVFIPDVPWKAEP